MTGDGWRECEDCDSMEAAEASPLCWRCQGRRDRGEKRAVDVARETAGIKPGTTVYMKGVYDEPGGLRTVS